MAPKPCYFPALENGQGLGVDPIPLKISAGIGLGTFHLTHHQLGYPGTGATPAPKKKKNEKLEGACGSEVTSWLSVHHEPQFPQL